MQYTMIQDATGLYIETEEVVCRPIEHTLFKPDEEVILELDKETALVIDATDTGVNAFKEQWKAVYKPRPVRVLEESVEYPPLYYVEHTGWYCTIMILLGIASFDLGLFIGSIWARI